MPLHTTASTQGLYNVGSSPVNTVCAGWTDAIANDSYWYNLLSAK